MLRYFNRMCLVAFVVLLSGCATNLYPGGPTPAGMLYSSTRSTASALAINIDPSAKMSITGTAHSYTVLGLIALGDSSVTQAMKNAGITRIHHVDYENKTAILGLFINTMTIVYGE